MGKKAKKEEPAEEVNIFNEVYDPRPVEDLRRYKVKYPELNRTKEFQPIPPYDLAFVWWVAYPGSPLVMDYEGKLKDRFAKAAFRVWGDKRRGNADAVSYKQGIFNEKMKAAMNRMSKIEFDTRRRCSQMVDKMLSDFETVVNKGIKDPSYYNADGQMDLAKYTTSMNAIKKQLPDIIKTKEEGFGILSDAKSGKGNGQNELQSYLQSKKEQK